MRLQKVVSKNATSYYVVKSVYENGKRSNRVVEKLGTFSQLSKLHDDVDAWAAAYVDKLNRQEAESRRSIIVEYASDKQIEKGVQREFNGGYLFLEHIFNRLGLQDICKSISDRYKFSYDLCQILAQQIYGRILFPSSKLSTFEKAQTLLEKPHYSLENIYRALEVIASESDFIQSEMYKHSLEGLREKKDVLYYDCTNFFFETEHEEGLKQYGYSKEHRPNPIVQMGLFLDSNGIPLAFDLSSGNTNEQTTLMPLEKRILEDFEISKVIICTDAGLSSKANRKFNNNIMRKFVTTQSIKKLDSATQEWALDKTKWRMYGDDTNRHYNLDDICNDKAEKYYDRIFYKETWIKEDAKENALEQRLIVTFSLKYKAYLSTLRENHILRAERLITSNRIKSSTNTDPKRFIKKTSSTDEGELATNTSYFIDEAKINEEAKYDGFYAVCTNLESDITKIIDINKQRWEIEESFRILKTEFKSRPVYLKRDDRIKAHFTICFIALTIFRLLEQQTENIYPAGKLIETLRTFNFAKLRTGDFVPLYKRTDITDLLHEKYGFRTDYEIISEKDMKKIFKNVKRH